MSRTVDQRVVEMRFDNRQFEDNVQTTMSTLEKFKRSLNLTGASKGLESVNAAARNIDFSGVGTAAETLTAKFSALQVMGVTALANITNSAVNAGKRIVSALTIDPVKTGFQEYETQINAVQTILSNTRSKGTTIDDVNGALDELNTYADKTIYNFTEMTRNIGTFTAAGVDLDKSVSSIKGIANLAAVSGSTSQQASTAMYQLSQALAAGKVQLMDWNSVVNAGMGGQVFQDALKRTARNMGTNVDAMIEKYGSFRESLTKGEWLTAEVLTETLTQLSGAYSEADLLAKGYTKEQAKEILALAEDAESAATKVKTFTQLWDTLKETAQSGWTQTWEYIIGDFEEARATLTKVSDALNEIVNQSSEARNELLKGWKEAGGRNDLLAGFENIFNGLKNIVAPIKEAFRDIFPEIQVEHLTSFTEGFKKLTAGFAEFTSGHGDQIKSIFKGIFSVLDFGRKILFSVGEAIGELLGSKGVSSLATFVLDIAASIGDVFTSINKSFDAGGLTGMLSTLASGISNFLEIAVGKFEGFGDIISWVGDIVGDVLGSVWDGVKTVFGWISDNFSAGDIFAGLAGGGIFVAAKKVSGFIDNIIDTIKEIFGKGEGVASLKNSISDILGSLHDSLNAFTTGIKISSLVSIAIAIGILSASLRTISDIDSDKIAKSLVAIGAMMMMLSITLAAVTSTIETYGADGIVKTGIALVLIAEAIKILADAMTNMSALSFKDISKGLIGIGGGLTALAIGLKIIGKTKISLSTSVAMLALAQSCKMLGDALHLVAQLSWDEIKRGLTAMGGALLEFTIALAILSKAGGFGSLLGAVGILVAVQSLEKMAEGLKSFGEMSWDEIKRGLVGMGGALAEIGIVLGTLGKIAGFSSIFAAGAILIVTQGLGDIADALKQFGTMTWDEIERGLTAMGIALLELEVVIGSLALIAGFSSIFAAGSIMIVIQGLADLADALKQFGEMSWDEIKRGLTGMGGALAEIGIVTGALGKISGFSAILGSGSILLTIQGLADLADALKQFGGMTWEEITRGLAGMGGALAEVGIVSGTLGALTGLSGLLGSGAILLGVQGLGELADALKQFGGMTWEEIKIGLVGMGGALAEVAIVTGALGALAGLPSLIGSGSILLAVQGLGDIADALQKFGEMSWDEIKRGLSAMGGALGEVALGGFLSTLSGLGAISISAIAASLGDLADGVNKWKDVTIPEGLGTNLGILADGVTKFTFGGLGAGALTEVSASLGVLADSVKKWTGVTVPEGLAGKFETLASAIKKFTWDGMGASALADAAPAIGQLADGIRKWQGVTVPETIGTDLANIAEGVKAFSFAFAGGWSLSALVTPLGNLSDSIKKWAGVTIPEGLSTGLSSLATGVKAFSFAFAGGWSLEAIVGPLGDLAGSIKKWAGVTIPEGLGDGLKSLAAGVKPFGSAGDLASVPGVVEGLVKSFENLANIEYSNISSGLSSVSDAIANIGDISTVSETISNLGRSIIDGLLEPITSAGPQFSAAGNTLVDELSSGVNSGITSLTQAANMLITTMRAGIVSKGPLFTSAGATLINNLAMGLVAGRVNVSTAITGSVAAALTTLTGYYTSFYSAGSYLVDGFAAGISANAFKAAAKARAMARAALEAAEDELDENSPSKEFYRVGDFAGMGFVDALDSYAKIAHKSGSEMAGAAKAGLQDAVTRMNDLINGELNTQPTIRPVLDLSDVRHNANTLGDMLAFGSSANVLANVGAISMAMNRRGQNGTNDDVVYAINKLRKDLGNVGGTTYQVNGITYDDGSNVSQAVKDLVRAAKVERRV